MYKWTQEQATKIMDAMEVVAGGHGSALPVTSLGAWRLELSSPESVPDSHQFLQLHLISRWPPDDSLYRPPAAHYAGHQAQPDLLAPTF